jgi:hypothetical protein
VENAIPDGARATLLPLILIGAGLLLAVNAGSAFLPGKTVDRPEPGFSSVPGVLEEGGGLPRDALRLVVTGVQRGVGGSEPWSMTTREARVQVRLEEDAGMPTSPDRWRILEPSTLALEGVPGVYGSVYSGTGMMFGIVDESGSFHVSLGGLPPGEIVVPRMTLDVPILQVLRPGRLHWSVMGDKDFGVTFLDRILFVEFGPDNVAYGAHSRGRFNPPTTIGTCLQGVLEEYAVLDALGKTPQWTITEGRSWGETYYGAVRGPHALAFPLSVEARWRRCGPTTTCRFVLEGVKIPAAPVQGPGKK